MKRLRDIFRCPRSFRLRSFRPRCLCAEDDVSRCQSVEEVYQRSGYSDVGLKTEPEPPAKPSDVFIQFILPGQCEELTAQEELNLPPDTELKLQVEEVLGTPEATSICELSESEVEVHVPTEPEVKPEIEAIPDPPEAASSSDSAELEQDLHILQREVEAFHGFPEDTYISALSDPEVEQHVLAEPEVKSEIKDLPDPPEAASSSDSAELEQDLHILQREVEAFRGFPEDTYISALSDPEVEQHVLAEPEVKSEIKDLPDPPEAASSSDFADLEQDLHELQCAVEAFHGFPEDTYFSALFDPEEEQHVLAEPEVKSEIEALPDPPEADSSSDFAEIEQDLHEFQSMVEAFVDAPEVASFSDLSESEEILYVDAESVVLSEATSGLRDFRCCSVLGQGAFGKVLLAEHKQTEDMIAIKTIKKADVVRRNSTKRLRYEKEIFQTVSSAHHPFLVNLFTCFQDEHYIFFVMEYAAGGDLLSNTRVAGSFPQDRAVFYVACVTLGLEFLHQNKIIHRDLKLGNVVLDKEGFAKVTDFGLSKAGIGFGDRTMSIVGTPVYMAPEMVTRQPYTRDVDWWSLGVLIYDMLAARTPFEDKNMVRLKHNIVNSEVTYPQDWSPESISLVSQLLVKNPAQRLGSGQKGAEDVKTHPFFRDIDWRKLILRELRPPFLPPLSGPEDVSNFDAAFTSMAPVLTSPEGPGLTQEQQDLFRDFDWTAEWAP